MTVNVGVLAGQVGLVEVVGVLHIASTETRLNNNRGVRANKKGDGASTACGTSIALGIKGNISSNNNAVPAVPGRGLDPVNSVEKSVGTAVASVDGINTLDVCVVAEKLHQHRLDRLGLVEDGLGTDLETTNRVGVDVVVLEEVGDDGQGERVDIYTRRWR